MGMAYTQMGGSTMYIESVADHFPMPAGAVQIKETMVNEDKKEKAHDRRRGGELFCTGQMGDVMKESTSIAYTVAKAQLFSKDPNNEFFERHRVHMHVPDGSTPKEGPSAGITMVTSLLSLAMNKPVRNNIAMTGELSLTGKVLAIGGVKEKVIAAKRSNVMEVIFPIDNKAKFEELPVHIREGVTARFVAQYDDVFYLSFGTEEEIAACSSIVTIHPPVQASNVDSTPSSIINAHSITSSTPESTPSTTKTPLDTPIATTSTSRLS